MDSAHTMNDSHCTQCKQSLPEPEKPDTPLERKKSRAKRNFLICLLVWQLMVVISGIVVCIFPWSGIKEEGLTTYLQTFSLVGEKFHSPPTRSEACMGLGGMIGILVLFYGGPLTMGKVHDKYVARWERQQELEDAEKAVTVV